ncbi:MAG: FHA domain-containing protein [Nitrospirae bacterium]|nr:FHA domain-containing protein [Nitrospirota bacterium]
MPFQLIVQSPHEQDFLALSNREWREECIVGRGEASHFRLKDQRRLISSRHAKITQQENEYVLMDIGSTNGTTLNGNRIEVGKPYSLAAHDQIGIGDFVLEFVIVVAEQTKVGMDDPDATVCLQPETTSSEALVEQLQAQYAEMMHLPSHDREALLVESLREAISEVPSAEQEELLSSIEKAFRDPDVFGEFVSSAPGFSSSDERNRQVPEDSVRDLGSIKVDTPAPPFDATEQDQVLNLLFEFLNDSMKGRRQFEKELDVEVTRILGKERQELKWAETSYHIRTFLFDHTSTPLPFPEKLNQLRQVLEDLTLHPVGLMAGFRECVRFLLKQLDPMTLEVECKNKKNYLGSKIMTMGFFGNHPAWEYFKEKHRQLREEEIKTFHRLLGPELAKGYLRVYQQKSPSSK